MLDGGFLFVADLTNRSPRCTSSHLFVAAAAGIDTLKHFRFLVKDFSRRNYSGSRVRPNESRILKSKRFGLVHRYTADPST